MQNDVEWQTFIFNPYFIATFISKIVLIEVKGTALKMNTVG